MSKTCFLSELYGESFKCPDLMRWCLEIMVLAKKTLACLGEVQRLVFANPEEISLMSSGFHCGGDEAKEFKIFSFTDLSEPKLS